MPAYKAPVEDALFLLEDVFHIERYANLPGFSEATPDVITAVLGTAARFCEEVLAPLNQVGDAEGCRRGDDGRVATPTGFKEAYRRYVEGGWIGVAVPPAYGGLGLPVAISQLISEFMVSANLAFAMYPTLTQGAIAALVVHGSDEQKALYVPKLASGEWTGTMNLTEAQCGTDLGLIRTRAARQADGSYRITGTKVFISAGEHDLAANIIHLVLARIEGAPPGTHGLSLFVVPKIIPNADGTLGARNAVSCGGLEDKMGIHGSATCVMNYDGATGWLIGEENRGLNAMFVMMNEARLGVGLEGLALSEVAYQNAAQYAKDRLQGRALTGAKFKDLPADPIIVHPDVRRMLLTIRAFNEAGRALILWTSLQSDVARRADDAKARQAAEDHMSLLTPGHQRRAHRRRVRQHGDGAAGARRPRLHPRMGHGAVRARRPRPDDLRGRERHPGARPRRPQARQGRRARDHGVLCRGAGLRPRARGGRRDEAARRAARQGARPPAAGDACGSCRTPSASPTTPAPGRPTTCISWGSSPSATCGAASPRRRMRNSAPTQTAAWRRSSSPRASSWSGCCRRPRRASPASKPAPPR